MESNSQGNITDSQVEKNTHSTQGNSRPENILCKNHETQQDELMEKITNMIRYTIERGNMLSPEIFEQLRRNVNNNDNANTPIVENVNNVNTGNVHNQNSYANNINADVNDNGNVNNNVNDNGIGNGNDNVNDVQQVFPPQNPNLPLSTPNPPYVPPEQPKAISTLDDALNNVLRQRHNTSSNPDNESITIEIATKYKDTIHVEDENTIEYQGTIYHPQTDEDGRKYFKIKYMEGERKVHEGKIYLVNTFNQFPGWMKPDDNSNESYVYSQTSFTIWFSQCHYLIMSYGQLKVYSLRYSQSIGKELSPMFLSTYNGLKHIITHPDEFVLTQDLYNIIFAYACLMYNMFPYYGDPAKWRPSKSWL